MKVYNIDWTNEVQQARTLVAAVGSKISETKGESSVSEAIGTVMQMIVDAGREAQDYMIKEMGEN